MGELSVVHSFPSFIKPKAQTMGYALKNDEFYRYEPVAFFSLKIHPSAIISLVREVKA